MSPAFSAHRCQSWRRRSNETTLKLPQSADDMRKYMAPSDARCPGCGVVSNIRQVEPEDLGGRSPDAGVEIRTGESGPGDEIQTVTLWGPARHRVRAPAGGQAAGKPWRVTVRYDDGSYARSIRTTGRMSVAGSEQ